jgi:hypothetical protein
MGRIIQHGKKLTRIANSEFDTLEERKILKEIAKVVRMEPEEV